MKQTYLLKILIINAVPLNGGDEALLKATIDGLKLLFPEAKLAITVLCNNPISSKWYLPQYDFDWDYEYTLPSTRLPVHLPRLKQFIKRLLPLKNKKIRIITGQKDFRRVTNLYRSADVIISSAGGYLNDHYDNDGRLLALEFALSINKPVILFGQSIGPFWQKRNTSKKVEVFNKVSAIILREAKSLEHLQKIGVENPNIYMSTDICFVYHQLYPSFPLQKATSDTIHIAMTFRPWKDEDERKIILERAAKFCEYLLYKEDVRITFISTCQGVPDYPDDARFAKEIMDLIPQALRSKCAIDGIKHAPLELIKAYTKFDLYIGMRLHGAILAMLGGTPAMNIGYEDKTIGIYSALGLENYQVHYERPIQEWKSVADLFFDDAEQIRNALPEKLDLAAQEAWRAFSILKRALKVSLPDLP